MKRIDSYGATSSSEFTEGSPVSAVPATRLSSDWLNVIQEEIATVIESAGLTLDQGNAYPTNNTSQLYQAIQAIITSMASSLTAELPVGTIAPFAGPASSIPAGWLHCNGASLSTTAYPDLFAVIGTGWGGGGSTFRVPDLRGQFLRGVDGGAGVDSDAGARTAIYSGGNTGDAVGSVQADSFKSHSHDSITAGSGLTQTVFQSAITTSQTSATSLVGGSETRPKNAAVIYMIRAV